MKTYHFSYRAYPTEKVVGNIDVTVYDGGVEIGYYYIGDCDPERLGATYDQQNITEQEEETIINFLIAFPIGEKQTAWLGTLADMEKIIKENIK